MNKFPVIPPTIKGLLAILLWSTSATAICQLKTIPHLEVLCLSFGLSGGYTLLRLWLKKEWHTLAASFSSWVLVLIGVLLQQLLYISAFKSAKAAEVDLIIYLWPSLAVVLATLYFKERVKIAHITSVLFGSIAVLLITCDDVIFNEFQFGHILAFCCACSWAIYSVFSRSAPKIHHNMFGIAYLAGLVVLLPLHLSYEEFVIPSSFQAGLLFYFSLMLTIGAFSLWTTGVRKGQSRYLMLTTYFKPFFSLSLLCAFGIAELSPQLLIAAIFIIASGISTNLNAFPQLKILFNSSVDTLRKSVAIKR